MCEALTIKTASKVYRHIRRITPEGAKRFLHKLGRFMGEEMLEVRQFPDVKSTLLVLRHNGFDPRMCVDIGAYKGEWTVMWKSVFPRTTVLMVEPQTDKATDLQSICDEFPGKVSFESALLGAVDQKEVVFYLMETGSSVLSELSNYSRTATKVKTITLDSTLKKLDITEVDFIKLDAQGYELEILKGAARTLTRTSAILAEVSLLPYNEGAPLAAEVVRFCDERGFQLCDICSDMRREDFILRQTDLLFVRRNSRLFEQLRLLRA